MKKPLKTDTHQLNKLSPEQADKIFHQISSRLNISCTCDSPKKKNYFFKQFYKKYLLKRAVFLAFSCFVLFLVLPGTLLPTSISKVSAASIDHGRTAKVEFYIDCLIPVQTVSASINDKLLNVRTEGYQHYSVDVPENGYLFLEVVSLTGIRCTENILIDSIDDTAPSIINHTFDEHTLTIYLTDNGGSGVDYSKIIAYSPAENCKLFPINYNETANYVTFQLPDTQIYIIIPDKNENKKIAILTPPN